VRGLAQKKEKTNGTNFKPQPKYMKEITRIASQMQKEKRGGLFQGDIRTNADLSWEWGCIVKTPERKK